MSKFCANCGTQLEDDAKFCAACGTATEEVPAANETAPKAESTPIISENAPAWQKKIVDFGTKLIGNKAMLAVVCGGVAAVLVLSVVISAVLSGPAYADAIDTYLDISVFGEFDKLEDAAPEAFWDFYEEQNDKTVDELIEDMEEYGADEIIDMLEEQYGDNIKVSYEITDEDELSEKKLDALADNLKDNYDIPRKSVTRAYKLDVELTIEGSEDEDTDDATMYVVKIDGDWYMCTSNGTPIIYSLIAIG